MKTKNGVVATFAFGYLAMALPASAEIFKCADKDGKISYQQTPCAESQIESRVTIAGPRWEKVFEWREAGSAWVTFLDASRITNEEFYKRIYLRTELQDGEKVLMSAVTEELFDCVNLRSKVLKLDGQSRPEGERSRWTSLDGDSRTRERAQKLKAKVCT